MFHHHASGEHYSASRWPPNNQDGQSQSSTLRHATLSSHAYKVLSPAHVSSLSKPAQQTSSVGRAENSLSGRALEVLKPSGKTDNVTSTTVRTEPRRPESAPLSLHVSEPDVKAKRQSTAAALEAPSRRIQSNLLEEQRRALAAPYQVPMRQIGASPNGSAWESKACSADITLIEVAQARAKYENMKRKIEAEAETLKSATEKRLAEEAACAAASRKLREAQSEAAAAREEASVAREKAAKFNDLVLQLDEHERAVADAAIQRCKSEAAARRANATCRQLERKIEPAAASEVACVHDNLALRSLAYEYTPVEDTKQQLERRILSADKIAAEAVAKAAQLQDHLDADMPKTDDEHELDSAVVWPLLPGGAAPEWSESENDDDFLDQGRKVTTVVKESGHERMGGSMDIEVIERRMLLADRVAAEAVVAAAMSVDREYSIARKAAIETERGLVQLERTKKFALQAERRAADSVAGAAAAMIALLESTERHREETANQNARSAVVYPKVGQLQAQTTSANEHSVNFGAQDKLFKHAGSESHLSHLSTTTSDVAATGNETTKQNEASRKSPTDGAVLVRAERSNRSYKSYLGRYCRLVARCSFGCALGLMYAAVGMYSMMKRRICRQCRARRQWPPSGTVEWLVGTQIAPNSDRDAIQKRVYRLRYLVPPDPCETSDDRLEFQLQMRLVAIMWIHAIGSAIIGSVGGSAYAAGLTWRPELGSPVGAPLSLATLSICKGGTSLTVFATLFQRARIPPCLAGLGCAPLPSKMESGQRPLPFRVLSSQLLKRMMTAKIVDIGVGVTLLFALRTAFQRASRRHRGSPVLTLLALTIIGLVVVDAFGTLFVCGTTVRYIHFLWKYPDPERTMIPRWDDESDDDSVDSEDSDDRDQQNSALIEAGQSIGHWANDAGCPAGSIALGPSMRWSDPSYARQFERDRRSNKEATTGLLSSHQLAASREGATSVDLV